MLRAETVKGLMDLARRDLESCALAYAEALAHQEVSREWRSAQGAHEHVATCRRAMVDAAQVVQALHTMRLDGDW